ncbi:(d)CMP kinase [Thiohalorhabdus methylotrophus]|uniref:Cytidylate kinase n=1 Tax=Thiohalorhabdus methylotrophus TaxID=3242694 RepID=A0ABV4U0H9_9GAMM
MAAQSEELAPVVTIDGPSGTGKGTLANLLARKLDWHYLDSGALYRAVAWTALRDGLALEEREEESLGELARTLNIRFEPAAEGPVRVYIDGQEVTQELRSGPISEGASVVAAMQPVRDGLLELQRSFRRPPGLVADGRDMGTVVFPEAPAKIFLTATAEERARRRYEQLRAHETDVTLERITQELRQRDERDAHRNVAPLRASEGAYIIDTTNISIDAVLAEALERVRRCIPGKFADG